MKIFLQLIAALTAFCALSVAPASAQQAPGDLFTVAGVRIDETAASATAARTQAMAVVQRTAFDILARRLVPPAQLATVQRPPDTTLDRLVRGVDVEEQPRSSGTRYLGRFAVRFDPVGVRSYLQAAGVTVSEARGVPVLIVPVIVSNTPNPGVPTQSDPWRAALEQGGFNREALPLLIAPATVVGPAEWATAGAAAGAFGLSSAIFAIARNDGASLVVDMIETSAAARTNRGRLTAPITGGDVGVPDAFRRLADSLNANLQAAYRAQSGGAALASGKVKMSVSALYRDQAEWNRIKEGLAASTSMISEIRIEAIARNGALVSFSYAGAPESLVAGLQRSGLSLADSPEGPVLRAVAR